jgi:Phospholipid methyltransferase
MRWRVRAGYPVAVVYLALADPKPRWILIGALVAAIGLLIRGASSGHLRKDRELATSGPYAHTRNPLYLGSALLAGGFAIAGGSWWAGLLVVAYFGVFYYAVMRNEEQDLHQRFGEAFDAYAARVPLFFPWFASADAAAGGETAQQRFSWAQYRRNREYQALIGTIAGVGVLFLRMWIRRRFGY